MEYKINKIPVIYSLDISTTCTAICVLNAETGEHIKTFHSLMNNQNKFPTFWSKVKYMKKVFDDEHEESWEIRKIAVEESAKRFTPGFSSADTIITLAKFNALICYILLDKYNIEPTYVNVRTARKKLGIIIDKNSKVNKKQQVLEQVVEKYPELPWIYKTTKGISKLVKINEDRCDAFVIGNAVL
jgi:hypothetical protein